MVYQSRWFGLVGNERTTCVRIHRRPPLLRYSYYLIIAGAAFWETKRQSFGFKYSGRLTLAVVPAVQQREMTKDKATPMNLTGPYLNKDLNFIILPYYNKKW